MPFTPTITPEIEQRHGAPLHIIVRLMLREGLTAHEVAQELGYKSDNSLHYALAKQRWSIRTRCMLVRLPWKGDRNELRHPTV